MSPAPATAADTDAPRRAASRTARAEIAIAAIVVALGVWIGTASARAFRAAGGVPEFYQSELGPAVMLACGRGFQNPPREASPALAAFLARASDEFGCASLPPSIVALPPTPFQLSSAYLQAAVALTWRLTGIGWPQLALLSGVLFGLVAVLTYGVLRLALRRALALLALVPALAWPPNLTLAPQLRDYAKGPLLLAVILTMGLLVVHSGSRRVVWWSALAGILIGIGVGFRTDAMIAIAPIAVTIALLSPPDVSATRRIAALAVFVATVVVVGWPAFGGYARGGNTGHVALLGLADDFDRTLRIRPASYALVGPYNDTMAFSIVNGFAARQGAAAGAALSTAEYDRLAMAYLRRIAAAFPADLILRAFAAILVAPRYVLDSSLAPPDFVRAVPARWLYRLRGSASARLAPLAAPAVIAATLIVGIRRPRAAALAVLVLAAFAGAAAIQFHERHFFYLQFVPWLAFGVLVEAALRRGERRSIASGRVLRVGAAGLAVVAGAALVLAGARAIQQRSARRLFQAYASAQRTPLEIARRRAGGATRFTAPEWNAPIASGAPRVVSRLIAVQLDAARCGGAPIDLTARYESVYPDADLSETRALDVRSQTTAFVAAYDRADESIRFRGVEVPADRAACVAGIFRVEGLESEPLLLTTTLAAGWPDTRLYQQLR